MYETTRPSTNYIPNNIRKIVQDKGDPSMHTHRPKKNSLTKNETTTNPSLSYNTRVN